MFAACLVSVGHQHDALTPHFCLKQPRRAEPEMLRREASPSPKVKSRTRARSNEKAALQQEDDDSHNGLPASQRALRTLVPLGLGTVALMSVLGAMGRAEPKVPVFVSSEMRKCWDPTVLPLFTERNASLPTSIVHTVQGCLHGCVR